MVTKLTFVDMRSLITSFSSKISNTSPMVSLDKFCWVAISLISSSEPTFLEILSSVVKITNCNFSASSPLENCVSLLKITSVSEVHYPILLA